MTTTRCTHRAVALMLALLLAPLQPAVAATPERSYTLTYEIELQPRREGARATIRIGEGANAMREIRLHIDPSRHRDFEGDGEITREGDRLVWTSPRDGGELRYFAELEHKRNKGGYDALVTDDWALFRGGDIFPPATVRTLKGAHSNARLVVRAPRGWSVVTPYRESDEHVFAFDHPHRRFDRPTGWMLAGKIGVRRSNVAGTRVAVAAPVGHDARRMDTLAFLRWTLPALREVFPNFDDRLLVVMAGEPMWRGGLSGPGSLYLHADRPLISENATSTLAHELVHVAMSVAGDDHDDWVVEGFAEYYSLELLRRAGAISQGRYTRALDDLRKWGMEAEEMFVRRATGPIKARAAVVMHRLDGAIAGATRGTRGLDDVVRRLVAEEQPLTYKTLCAEVGKLAPSALKLLDGKLVPGAQAADCRARQATASASIGRGVVSSVRH